MKSDRIRKEERTEEALRGSIEERFLVSGWRRQVVVRMSL
jgi:hypothetical protein